MYSFDVFDTLITRRTAVPKGIFAIMQSELERKEYAAIPESIRKNFHRLRIEAERLARYSYQDSETEDVTLGQIYEMLAVRGELDDEQKKQLAWLECDIEYRECVPVEKNVIQIKKLLSDGENVILISDMYLPKKQIYRMLAKADTVLEKLPLYVSGDCKKRKSTGRIYELAMAQSHFAAGECIHTGDNEEMDLAAAERKGLYSRLSWFPRLLPIEKRLLDETPGNVWLNRVIGCSRRARLHLGEEMSRKDEVRAGTSIGGILLGTYMQWVIGTALAKGINRLYFAESDGNVLKRIADILIQKAGYVIETRYRHGIEYTGQEMDLSDDRSAFVTITERNSDFYKGRSQVFFFNLDSVIEKNHCGYFVFYPGIIRKRDILEKLHVMLKERNDYLSGIEKFTELFCEDGHMVVPSEDMEQIFKILAYITEMSDELLNRFL